MGPLEFLPEQTHGLGAQTVITAPNVLQRFHSTRRMASAYEGETVTFLLSVGLRDPKSAQAWGLLTNLCGNSSGKVIGLRMRATRMDRQPLAKVVSERFPPPATRRSGNQAPEAEDRRPSRWRKTREAGSIWTSASQSHQCLLCQLLLPSASVVRTA